MNEYMKKKIIVCLLLMIIGITLTGCAEKTIDEDIYNTSISNLEIEIEEVNSVIENMEERMSNLEGEILEKDINNMVANTKLPLLYLSSYETLVVDNIGIDVEYNAELKSYEVILIVEGGYSNHICIIDCNAHYLEVTIYDYDGYIIESGVIKFGREYIQNYNRFIEEIEFSLGPYGYYSLDVEITCFEGR